jgi:hypothetical protein
MYLSPGASPTPAGAISVAIGARAGAGRRPSVEPIAVEGPMAAGGSVSPAPGHPLR